MIKNNEIEFRGITHPIRVLYAETEALDQLTLIVSTFNIGEELTPTESQQLPKGIYVCAAAEDFKLPMEKLLKKINPAYIPVGELHNSTYEVITAPVKEAIIEGEIEDAIVKGDQFKTFCSGVAGDLTNRFMGGVDVSQVVEFVVDKFKEWQEKQPAFKIGEWVISEVSETIVNVKSGDEENGQCFIETIEGDTYFVMVNKCDTEEDISVM